MDTAITSIFTALGNVYNIIVSNPLLALGLGLAVAGLIFSMLISIFKKR